MPPMDSFHVSIRTLCSYTTTTDCGSGSRVSKLKITPLMATGRLIHLSASTQQQPRHAPPPLPKDRLLLPCLRTTNPNPNPLCNTRGAKGAKPMGVITPSGKLVLLQYDLPDDIVLDLIHPSCKSLITRLVNREALERGLVVVRCDKRCDQLIAVVDHGRWFGDGHHQTVETALAALGVQMGRGCKHSFCATFETFKISKA